MPVEDLETTDSMVDFGDFTNEVDVHVEPMPSVPVEEVLRVESFRNTGLNHWSARLTTGLPMGGHVEAELSETERQYWPFKNTDQWKLAMWALFPTPLPKPRAELAIVAKHAVWAKPDSCFESWGAFQRLVQQVEAKGGEWRRYVIHRGDQDPMWYPVQIRFWARDSLELLKELVGDVKVVENMKWAPEKVYNSKGDRLYSELWTGDWWWKMQVLIDQYFADFRKKSVASWRRAGRVTQLQLFQSFSRRIRRYCLETQSTKLGRCI